jgi:indolepyruvate decarboxylase
MKSRMPLADFLAEYLRRVGVRHLFGIPGDLVLRLFARLGERRGFRIVTLSHEPAVGFAADGYARATGRLAVACVTYGAGGLNMVNAVAGSFAEHVPVLVVSGGPGTEERKLGTLIHHQAREIESQLRIYREVTAEARVLEDPRTAAESIDEVVRTMWREQRPGYLEIHRDMVDRVIEVPKQVVENKRPLEFARSDPRKVREAARETAVWLGRARKPVVMVGIETFRFKLEKDVIELCERLGAPVMTTVLAKGAVPMDHPLYMGVHIGPMSPPKIRRRVDEADLVVNLGTLLTDMNLGSRPPTIMRDKSVWAVNNRVNVSFHTYTDVVLRDFVRALLDEDLKRHQEKIAYHDNLPPAPAWLATVSGARSTGARHAETSPAAAARRAGGRRLIRVAEVLHVLNAFLRGRRDHVVVAESGDMLFAGLDVRIGGRAAYFAQGYYASMGFGVPGALGVQLGTGKRPIILCGDGSFQMTGTEIAHAPRLGLAPIVLVMNNGGWGIFRPVVKEQSILEIPPWPYAALASLLGGTGARVATGPELWAALEAAESSSEFHLIEVMIDRDDLSPVSRKYIQASTRQRSPSA